MVNPKYSPYRNAEGFYNASGSESIPSVAAKYGVELSALAVRYGVSVDELRQATLSSVALRAHTTAANVDAQIKAMGTSSDAGKNKGLFTNAMSFITDTINSTKGNQTPTYAPTYTPDPSQKEGFKIGGMNGYLVLGGGAAVLVGLIFLGTKLLKKS